MKPGVTSPLPLARTVVRSPTSRAMAALSPRATIVSPRAARACTKGRAESPVQIRPKTARSAGAAETQPVAARSRTGSATRERVGIAASATRRERARGQEVANVEQDFQHQLVALISGIQLFHAACLVVRLGPGILLAVGGFEIGQDLVA